MLRVILAALVAGSAIATSIPSRRDQEPCAAVATAIASTASGQPIAFSADIALSCLRSVPLQKDNDSIALKAFKGFVQFESNLAYLKNPPPGALYPAVDILAGLDDIESKLESDYYKNEFDFQYDIWSIAASAHDYHFNYNVDIMSIFTWKREQALVSVSTDGLALPSIYLQSDVAAINGSSENKPSPITKINDVDVETWLLNYADRTPFGHDPDANYNNVLYSASLASRQAGNANGSFTETQRPQNAQTKLTFANGTEFNLYTYASTGSNFTDITDGASLFKKFCTGQPAADVSNPEQGVGKRDDSTATVGLNSFTAVPTQTAIPLSNTFFPKPLVLVQDYSVAGYLPEDMPDTAILHIPSFDPKPSLVPAFQNAVRGLLATAQAEGRKKLIIDLRGNGGGIVYLGYDTFRQIFPSITPYGGTTLRSPPLYRDITGIIYDYAHSTPADQWPLAFNVTSSSSFRLEDFFDNDNKFFTSAQAQYGPFQIYNDNQTAIERTDMGNAAQTNPVAIYGFNGNTLPIQQVFQPNDIVILQDGICGSTCAIFSEFMKSQGLVKTVVVGGRKQDGPMQAVGGTKGAEVVTLETAAQAFNAAKAVGNSTAQSTLVEDAKDLALGYQALATRVTAGKQARVNFRNNIREGDSTYTPLQYVYEAADCRIFYTPQMYEKQTVLYGKVHDIHWGNASCVAGSADHPSSLSGGLLSYINSYPPVGANYTFGATEQPYPSGIANPASTVSAAGTPTSAPTTGATVLATSTTYVGTQATSSSRPTQSAKSWASSRYHGCAGGLVAAVLAVHML